MRKLLVLVVLMLGGLLAGCAGMVDSYPQRANRYKNDCNYAAREFVDDFDYFWLADQPIELTEWPIRDAD